MITLGNNEQFTHEQILEILKEEDRFFVSCHHRPPVGREYEDVVENAFTRLHHLQPVAYTEVDRVYQEMRCKYAGA